MGAADILVKKIENREATVGVCGLGYVGLPLVRAFHKVGFTIYGFDIDQSKVDNILAGKSYIEHIDFGELKSACEEGKFIPTTDFGRIGEPDVILIAVPTPLNQTREPDLEAVRNTCEQIAKGLRKEQLVVLESTTYPGTTEEVCIPILETSGLKAGEDFYVAYSPEREDPGNPNFETRTIPKVVGALEAGSQAVANAVYHAIIEKVVPVSSMKAAELSKIFENTFRAVNIALVNELKLMCLRMGIDVWEVIDAASTKPFGFMPFYPGPGLGGHCIPIDPFYLTWKAREYDFSTRFIELAGEINSNMPYEVVDGVMHALNDKSKSLKGANVLVLGVAYKKNVDDLRESPSLKIIDILLKKGAKISYNDPHIPVMKKSRHYPNMPEYTSVALTPETLGAADAVLILTDHDRYDQEFINKHAQLVIDTRNATKKVADRSKIVKL
ncbi:MAG: nucleotide sugar dehydrogenase [Myxococcales bacterium]|nr:nucleotide sugar dehydrogenase [Myxococcales bacterium]MCB9647308.1 nucleotide sugar dehydrogenase [Deltaproteobacteria bacterium]